MLHRIDLLTLVSETFENDLMREAFAEELRSRIDYDELAGAIAETHEDEIAELIIEMAEDALT